MLAIQCSVGDDLAESSSQVPSLSTHTHLLLGNTLLTKASHSSVPCIIPIVLYGAVLMYPGTCLKVFVLKLWD